MSGLDKAKQLEEKGPSGGKRVRDIPTAIVLCHSNTKPTTINICGEDLVQTQVDSVIVSSVSVIPYEPCLVDSMGLTLLVSSLIPTIPSPLFLWGFLSF